MMKDLVADENMSNLTSASSEISASSGTMNDAASLYPQQSSTSTNQEPQPKKKRSLPGHPDPDAEVIALSPKTLLATNRFICEICNKGFKRDQNLQLHRRGHNLPWKLKQRTNKEVIRKKVYVCPEATCVHHDPARALGDLTGIKKHFCRKHGEKKWKCEKCSKRYAVQSDWKAHSKICGTREYKCDCGTLFSRRDSFITHRAFCDALAQESARAITAGDPLLSSHSQNQLLRSHGHLLQQAPQLAPVPVVKKEQELVNLKVPEILPWLACPPRPLLDFSSPTHIDHQLSLIHHENPTNPTTPLLPAFQSSTASPYMSATALLQKASQIGATVSKAHVQQQSQSHHDRHVPAQDQCTTATAGYNYYSSSVSMASSSAIGATTGNLGMPSREDIGIGYGLAPPHDDDYHHGLASYKNKVDNYLEQGSAASNATPSHHHLFHDMMGTVPSAASGFVSSSSFEETLRGVLNNSTTSLRDTHCDFDQQQLLRKSSTDQSHSQFSKNSNNNKTAADDEMTRDFLGLKPFSQRDFFNISGLHHLGSSSYGKQSQNQAPWQG